MQIFIYILMHKPYKHFVCNAIYIVPTRVVHDGWRVWEDKESNQENLDCILLFDINNISELAFIHLNHNNMWLIYNKENCTLIFQKDLCKLFFG